MSFADELRDLSPEKKSWHLDPDGIERAALSVYYQVKERLRKKAARGDSTKAGLFGTKRKVSEFVPFHISSSLLSTPKRTYLEPDMPTGWALNNVDELKLIANRMNELGAADGIKVRYYRQGGSLLEGIYASIVY